MLSAFLTSTAVAAALTMTVTGAPAPIPNVPCSKITKGDRVYVYVDVTQPMLQADEEVVLRLTPPAGSICVPSTMIFTKLGDKSAYRTWNHMGLDACSGRWSFSLTTRYKGTTIEKRVLLVPQIGVKVGVN